MQFLIDADLPKSVTELMHRLGYITYDVRDIGLFDATDETIAAYAQKENICLMSGDFGFADIRHYPPEKYHGIVVLELPYNANAQFILHLVALFLDKKEIVKQLRGRLAIVSQNRIRLRPPLEN